MDTIAYRILRRPRRKRAAIVIHPDNRIEVHAPSRMATATIERFIQEKRAWIEKKQHDNRTMRTPYRAKQFTNGENFQLLGHSYPLRIQTGTAAVTLKQHEILLSHPDLTGKPLKEVMTAWYKEQAQRHFQQRAIQLSEQMACQPRLIGIKSYRSRWGTCHSDGRIYFNWRLIMAPNNIVDYVIIHELAHLTHPNHSRQFWQLVSNYAPDHKQSKLWLKNHGLSLDL